MDIPLVSICTITYGHENYISDTIEGVLMQEVNFPVEFIIADDCSPDNTSTIVQEYIDNHPKGHWIKYTRHKKNKGMNPNFVWAMEQCKGKYIALCEGDDYWTDALKLQKQVDFLEKNHEFAACATNSQIFYEDQSRDSYQFKQLVANKVVSVNDLIEARPFHTATLVFRSFSNLPNEFTEVLSADRLLFLFLATK